jgi:hypothetical protein
MRESISDAAGRMSISSIVAPMASARAIALRLVFSLVAKPGRV